MDVLHLRRIAGALLVGIVALAWFGTDLALAEESPLSFSLGTQYSTGEYGGTESVDEVYVPFTTWYDAGRYSLRLTIPYLSVEAPSGTVIEGPGGQPILGDGPRTTESGLGDIVAGATIHDALTAMNGDLALDLTGKVKFGTADEDKGLGTGETDTTLQAEVIRYFERGAAIAALGYVFRGDAPDLELDDGMVASAGGILRGAGSSRAGLFLGYREASLASNDDVVEICGQFGWRWKWLRPQIWLAAGLTDSAPDWSAGLAFGAGY